MTNVEEAGHDSAPEREGLAAGALGASGRGPDSGPEADVPADAEVAITVDDVMDALSNVIDPELGLDFVELGLIYGVEVDGRDVHVTFTLTTPGCPIGPQVTEQIEEFVGEIDGIGNVHSEMVFTPPWSPERMSEDAKFALGY
jgi:metal-sulfur cluster biosynthetic enzyme